MKTFIGFLVLELAVHGAAHHTVQARNYQQKGETKSSVMTTMHHTIIQRIPGLYNSPPQSINDRGVGDFAVYDEDDHDTSELPGTFETYGRRRETRRHPLSSTSPSPKSDDLHDLKLELVDTDGYISIFIDGAGALSFCKHAPGDPATNQAEIGEVHKFPLGIGRSKVIIPVRDLVASGFCRKVDLSEGSCLKITAPGKSRITVSTLSSMKTKQSAGSTTRLIELPSATQRTEKSKESKSTTLGAGRTIVDAQSVPLLTPNLNSLESTIGRIVGVKSTMTSIITSTNQNLPIDSAPLSHFLVQNPASSDFEFAASSRKSRAMRQVYTKSPPRTSYHSWPLANGNVPIYKTPSIINPASPVPVSSETGSGFVDQHLPSGTTPLPSRMVKPMLEMTPPPSNAKALSSTGDAPLPKVNSINLWYEYINSFMKTADVSNFERTQASVVPERDEQNKAMKMRRWGICGANAEMTGRGMVEKDGIFAKLLSEEVAVKTAEEEEEDDDDEHVDEGGNEMTEKTTSVRPDEVASSSDAAKDENMGSSTKLKKPTAVINEPQFTNDSPISSDDDEASTPPAKTAQSPSPVLENDSKPPVKSIKPSLTNNEEDTLPSSNPISLPMFIPTFSPGDYDSGAEPQLIDSPPAQNPRPRPTHLPQSTPHIPSLSLDVSFEFPTPTLKHHARPPTAIISASALSMESTIDDGPNDDAPPPLTEQKPVRGQEQK
ncbi:hypothetical protein T440DRAFT_559279 [Plenodomus tracheiphilus IPT5]|uniref:Uncharacterized protein n=1 Tax=Plenodomus tracheiphilus IPT5 TaxID=1408161 RepID=A0A6A7AS99_9PLEO|nr:hypothetical protein T440DRAFT_559279 [Plenodomus tracheiphilus IPT5]